MTVKEQVSVFDELSVAVHTTVVSPNVNTELDAGEQTTVGVAAPLSVAVGAVNVTVDDVVSPVSALEDTSPGQAPITGSSLSVLKTKQFIEDQNTEQYFEHLESHRK